MPCRSSRICSQLPALEGQHYWCRCPSSCSQCPTTGSAAYTPACTSPSFKLLPEQVFFDQPTSLSTRFGPLQQVCALLQLPRRVGRRKDPCRQLKDAPTLQKSQVLDCFMQPTGAPVQNTPPRRCGTMPIAPEQAVTSTRTSQRTPPQNLYRSRPAQCRSQPLAMQNAQPISPRMFDNRANLFTSSS